MEVSEENTSIVKVNITLELVENTTLSDVMTTIHTLAVQEKLLRATIHHVTDEAIVLTQEGEKRGFDV